MRLVSWVVKHEMLKINDPIVGGIDGQSGYGTPLTTRPDGCNETPLFQSPDKCLKEHRNQRHTRFFFNLFPLKVYL